MSSVLDPNTLYLDPDPEWCPNLDPDPDPRDRYQLWQKLLDTGTGTSFLKQSSLKKNYKNYKNF